MRATIHPREIPRTRRYEGRLLFPQEEMLMFHRDAGPVPETLGRLLALLEKKNIEYVVIGGFALGAHQYRRATEDMDVCLRAADIERFRQELVGTVYQRVEGRQRRFYDPQTQVTFDLLISGELAGHRGRNQTIRFPDPSEATDVGGLTTVSLERLIELKLVTWRVREMADVIELIRRNNLSEDFAERLHELVRTPYLECYDHKVEEDRQEREYGEH